MAIRHYTSHGCDPILLHFLTVKYAGAACWIYFCCRHPVQIQVGICLRAHYVRMSDEKVPECVHLITTHDAKVHSPWSMDHDDR